ncbi:methyltransferase domain-containing protein [Streptomyces sp. M19]
MARAPRGFAGCGWLHRAFLEVPREHFVPDRVWWPAPGADGRYPSSTGPSAPRVAQGGLPARRGAHHADRGRRGRRRRPGDGAFTSSISAAGVVVEMLRHLAPEPGEKVLEIGTGTGYTTALLAHRVGDVPVVTVEIDARIADRARDRLHGLGVRPRCVTADGEEGCADGGPYDRILSTASVRRIPAAWLGQLRPGGVLVAPLDTPFGHDLLVLLVADEHGGAVGRPVAPVAFMRTRGQRRPRPYAELGWPEALDAGRWAHLLVTAGPSGQRVTVCAPN